MRRKTPTPAQLLVAAVVMALIALVSLLLAARYLFRCLFCSAGLLINRVRRPRLTTATRRQV